MLYDLEICDSSELDFNSISSFYQSHLLLNNHIERLNCGFKLRCDCFSHLMKLFIASLYQSRVFCVFSLPHGPLNRTLTEAAIGRNAFKGNEVVMLQAGPCFFGYQHVLKALKNVVIPLPQYITTPPCEKQQVPKMGQPAYLDTSPAFDMSMLAKNSECLSTLDGYRCAPEIRDL